MKQTTYKFRLYPTKTQEQKLLWTLDRCRLVYNHLLEQKSENKLKRKELQALLPDLKKRFPELQGIYSKVLQYENYRLHSNIMALHQLKKNGRKVGRLRFKGRNWFKTFTYNQSGFKITEYKDRHDILHLSKIGDIPLVVHRRIEGEIKQITVKHMPSGKWFAFVITDIEEEKIEQTQNARKVGIDLGLENFVCDSEGNSTSHPRFLKKSLDKLGREQRKLSRKQKGSKNRKKQRIKVARVHEKVANQRSDFLHKLNRMHKCECGFTAERDYNSALNILKKGILPERQESTPVETEPLPIGQAWSLKQEASSERKG